MFNSLPIWMCYAILILIVFIFIMLACMAIGRYRTLKFYTAQKHGKFLILSALSCIAALFTLLPIISLHKTAKSTGAVYEDYLRMNYGSFKTVANMSLRAKMPKTNQKGIIIVLYRYNCPDCEKLTPDIKRELPSSNNHIYYVPSRSSYGKQLVKQAGIQVVPSIVYIKNNQRNGKYLTSPLNHNNKLNQKAVKYYKKILKSQY